jgi:tRNA (adenine22-N1)-methyltransferase
MKLSKRLEAISDFIEETDRLIDIGCDHAILDIFLCKKFKGINIIASDIHEGALNQAKSNIEKHNLLDRIEIRLGDGLTIVNPCEFDTIVISGMGFHNIKKILSNKPKMIDYPKIVIQCNTDVVKLRKFVIKLGYMITREKLVMDNDIIYTVIEFKKGTEKYNYDQIYFGPRILENKDELFYEYYSKKLLKYENLLLQLPWYEVYNTIHHKHLIKIIGKQLKDKKDNIDLNSN